MRTTRSMVRGSRGAAWWLAALVLLSMIAGANVASAAPTTLRVVCADWFYTNKNQVHVELHVEDELGDGVPGVTVTVENSVDSHSGCGRRA